MKLKKELSPYYNGMPPRKLKKKIKRFCNGNPTNLSMGEMQWFYLERNLSSLKLRKKIINKICETYGK